MTLIESSEAVPEPVSQHLRMIAGAMAAGLTFMGGLVGWAYANSAGVALEPDRVRFINTMTMIAMGATFVLTLSSEWLWRHQLKTLPGALGGRVQIAFILRLAAREAAGLLGMTVCYLAAANGTLRAYPAYWVNLVPLGLFLVFIAAHWPAAERLTSEARDVLGNGPVSSQ